MNFGVIKGEGTDDNNSKRKKLNKIAVILIVAAIGFLAFGSFGKNDETKKAEDSVSDFNIDRYKKTLEGEAEEALSKIKGAGNVRVILSFDSAGKSVVARDSQSKTQTDSGDSDSREIKEVTDSVVVYGQGQSEQPYVTEEKMPLPSGVLVIAEGAENETVQYELYEAVKALYGIPSHRIKVASAKKENN